MTPLISVLIPAYNHEKYIAECVESVLAQDWPRMELLIVDDGSRDGTWSQVQMLAKRAESSGQFERVEVATQKNQGTCVTLNRLCGMAKGDVVAIIASDDKYLPGAFSAMMKPMLADDAVGVVVGQNGFMDGESRDCFWDKGQNVVYEESLAKYRTFNEQLREISGVEDNGEGFGRHAELLLCNHIANGYLIRRRFLDLVLPFRKEAPLEDHWLHLQLSKVCKYRAVPAMTFRYRWHAANTIRQKGRMLALRYRTLKYEERLTGRPIVREEIKFSLGRLLSLRKEETLEEKRKVLKILDRDVIFRRRSMLKGMQLRCMAVVHVYYPERWPELAACIRSIDDPCDLVVTYGDEASVEQARREFPDARFLKCENVGYDVWPFIRAIRAVDLDDYDVVVKLHTKRDLPVGPGARPFNGFLVDGPRWRNQLLRFVRTREAWERTKARLLDPRVGMVADRWVIVKEKGTRFVAGTMFAAKPSVLKPFLADDYSADRFAPADDEHMGSFAHECERLFGRAVRNRGLAVVGFSGSEWAFCTQRILKRVKSFLWRVKVSADGKSLVKVCKIPVWRKHAATSARDL